jgi:polar amino acid transport system ATP-binding protein
MIEVRNLYKRFREHVVLDHIDLDIQKGEVVAVIGPSGAGKSTFLRCLNFLEEPEAGSIKINDFHFDVQKRSREQIRTLRQYTAMVFQQYNLFRRKTALENVAEGLVVVKKLPKREAEQIAYEHLKKVGLGDKINHYPRQLSGGQQQRVGIARALAMEPSILLFDEPTSALDPELVGEVLDTIRTAAQEGNTMIIVSHELNFVQRVANRVLFLADGKIIADGTPKEVFEHPKNDRIKDFLGKFYQYQETEYTI